MSGGGPHDPRLDSERLPGVSPRVISIGSRSAYLVLFSQIGLTLLAANLGGALLGNWVDGLLHSRPLFLILGFAGGFAVGAIGSARQVARALRAFDAADAAARAARIADRLEREQGGEKR
ncbi:MAG: putative F0F1-ATPase subunit Ca2+/Mg2+ transporter [Chloroflexota bacterium]